jgi:hypothetical protein
MEIQKISAGLVQLFIAFHAGSLVMGDAPASLFLNFILFLRNSLLVGKWF